MCRRHWVYLAGLLLLVSTVPSGSSRCDALAPDPCALNQSVVVEQINIRNNRRIPDSTIRVWIGSREGKAYSPVQLDRDVRTLYAQGQFADVKVWVEEGSRGGKVITFEFAEWPILLDIKYEGLKSVPVSTVLEELRKRAVGLSKDSPYNPVKARRAALVIKELLANEGYPEATVEPQAEPVSAGGTAVVLTFKVDEGQRFRIAAIEFEGNRVFSTETLRRKMKLVKQVGLFTTFSSKDVYHKERLQADLDRLRVLLYADNGYLRTRFGEPRVEEVGEIGSGVPLVGHNGQGLKIVIPVEEGRQYRAGAVKIEDAKAFPPEYLRAVFGLNPGDIVRGYSILNRGVERLTTLYGSIGYIQFQAAINPEFHDDANDATKGTADVTVVLDEGRQYILHRLDFVGNTFTRDNVLRREVLLNEGERYSERLWDLSILHLNQLGFFDPIEKHDATINTNEVTGQADIALKVQEKNRQQVSFTGGVAGDQGSYVGVQYSTNNLLGYGESLSLSVAAGNLQKSASFAFSEPYVLGRPIRLGFQVFYQDYKFVSQGLGVSPTADQSFGAYGGQPQFSQQSAGGNVSASAPLSFFARHFQMGQFVHFGLSYAYSTTDTHDLASAASDSARGLTFAQSGVAQSTLTPTVSYNTLNGTLDPTTGKSIVFGSSVSGGLLGGDVNAIAPYAEFKMFRPLFAGREASRSLDPRSTRTFGFRALFGHTAPFGTPFQSNSAAFIGGTPLSSRYYLGGEDSIRGYNTRSIAPLVPVEQLTTTRNVFAADLLGNRLPVRNKHRGTANTVAGSVINQFTGSDHKIADASYVPIGGDSQLLFNFEYRIPVVGPLMFVPFADIGSAFNMQQLKDQVIQNPFVTTRLNQGELVTLNPHGKIASQREIREATTPEILPGSLPPGFRRVSINGDQQTNTQLDLSQAYGGLLRNARCSLGGEFRIQVPVINVPFRLIFAWNPNARVNNPWVLESRHAIRFSVGRTF